MTMNVKELIPHIESGKLDASFEALYLEKADAQKDRYIKAVRDFAEIYGEDKDVSVFSVPGRSEISGNHTDHNRGCVIAGAVNLDIIAVVSPRDDSKIYLKSEGHPSDYVDFSEYSAPDEKHYYTSESLIAGMCRGFENRGYKAGGFDAFTTNQVHKGSGLSSSAAFEVMIGNILNHLYNDGRIENYIIAEIAQYSENVFFGKPCGLMDQTACAVGGFVAIDFEDPEKAKIEPLAFDLTSAGYSLCITNTGGNHADLNDDYASVPAEMKKIAAYFGRDVLRGVSREEIIENIPVLRVAAGDRAVMRALHYKAENERVAMQTEALRTGDLNVFFDGVRRSGDSSFKYLQNVYTVKNVEEQGLSLALCLTELFLGDRGAFRVHGGGFAGTIQAFVPLDMTESYKAAMDAAFGEGACSTLKIRPQGAIKVF